MLEQLPAYEELRGLEEKLRVENKLTFDAIFNEPTGYYMIKCFLIADYAVDKAIFIKDVEAYKSMRFESARRKVALLLYQRFVATDDPSSSDFKAGSSVFQIILSHKGMDDKGAGGSGMNVAVNKSLEKSDNKSDKVEKTVVSSNLPSQSNVTQMSATAGVHGVPGAGQDMDFGLSGGRSRNESTFQMGTNNNPIGVYGKSIRIVKDRVLRGEAPKDLFDEVARDVMTDLKLDVYPRFQKSEFYKKYIRTKWIETQKVAVKDFTTFRVLGRGGFGAVHACRKKNSGQIYAMKCINKKLVKVKSALDNVLEERNVLTMMKSNFVTNLKYALQDEDTLYLIMDLMLGGDLKFHLINAGRFTEKRARFYAAQVLLGLEHVHKMSIIYRDMKLENVLLDHSGNCRLSDLGLAVVTKVKIKGYAGTPGYTAPEMIKNKLYGPAADIFSYGVMLYRMLCIAEGTLVNLASGVSVPIELVQVKDSVLALGVSGGLVSRSVAAIPPPTQKACIELLFDDGRTLVCSGDHLIRTDDGRWVRADKLVPNESFVQVGVEYPKLQDYPADTIWQMAPGRVINPNQAVAYASIFGYLLTNDQSGKALLGNSIDVTMFNQDLALLNCLSPESVVENNGFAVHLNLDLTQQFIALGMPTGDRVDQLVQLPAWLLSADCPPRVVQAFLGGFFGGDGHSFMYAHTEGRFLGLGWSTLRTGRVLRQQLKMLQQEFTPLLVRCGIPESALRWSLREVANELGEQLSEIVDDSIEVDANKTYKISLLIDTLGYLPFSQSVGFRYSSDKATRLSAAVAWLRSREFEDKQRTAIRERVLELCDIGASVPEATRRAKSELSEKQILHPRIEEWSPPSMQALNASVNQAFITAKDSLSHWGVESLFTESGSKQDSAQKELKAKALEDEEEESYMSGQPSAFVASPSTNRLPSAASSAASSVLSSPACSALSSPASSVFNSPASSRSSSKRTSPSNSRSSSVERSIKRLGRESDDSARSSPSLAVASSASPAVSVNQSEDKFCIKPLETNALPVYRVQLVGVRSVGIRRCFDLSVPPGDDVMEDVDSFTAAGIVVHNCGSKPFKGKVDRDLDKAVIERKPQFPKEIFSKEAISLLTGLLQKRPENRLGCTEKGIEEIKEHPFFEVIDWGLLEAGYIDPPFVPNKFDVNAASLKDIGDFDRAKYKHVKLDERFKQRIKNFEYVSAKALQDEMVLVLEKADENVNFEKFAHQPEKQEQTQVVANGPCCTIV